MNPKYSLIIVLMMLLVGGFLVMKGNPKNEATLSGVMEVLGDAQRAAVKPVMVATRVSPAEEQELGKKLAGYVGYGSSVTPAQKEMERYVRDLGNSLAGSVQRKEIAYEFHVIQSETVNAFALPGGQIFVYSGLVGFVESEAELASILAHEITHVDARHCIELFQAEMAARKITEPILGSGAWLAGVGASFLSRVSQVGYRKFQEFEADLEGLRMVVAAGYDPKAAETVMRRLGDKFQEKGPQKKAGDPIQEMARAAHVAADSYFRSHPPSLERVAHMENARNYMDLKNRDFYRGKQNLKSLQSRRANNIPEESFRWPN